MLLAVAIAINTSGSLESALNASRLSSVTSLISRFLLAASKLEAWISATICLRASKSSVGFLNCKAPVAFVFDIKFSKFGLSTHQGVNPGMIIMVNVIEEFIPLLKNLY